MTTAARLVSRLSVLAIGTALVVQAFRAPPRPSTSNPQTRQDPEHAVSGAHRAGRGAANPWEIPASGWKAVVKRTFAEFSADRVMAVAAGVTFYALLAIFPAITAFVSLYGLVADRAALAGHVDTLSTVMPQGGVAIVSEQLTRLTSGDQAALSFGFAFSLALAIWSANAGMKAIFDALNVAYDETEKRGFIRLNLVSLCFTAGAILFLLIGLVAIAAVPIALSWFGLEGFGPSLIAFMRWPLLLVVTALALSVLYRFGPSRAEARWQWLTPGSLLASLLWIVVSVGFSYYAANFASYNETYGTLGAVIAFMTWMWLSTAVILFGAELNAEAERQTARDSTTGPPRPVGARGAAVADDVAG